MTQAILPLVAAYVAVAVLLLSLNLTSRWAWPIKAAAIGVTTGFFGLSYIGAVSLLGWPAARPCRHAFSCYGASSSSPTSIPARTAASFFGSMRSTITTCRSTGPVPINCGGILISQSRSRAPRRSASPARTSPVERRKSRRRTKLMSRIPIRSWDHPDRRRGNSRHGYRAVPKRRATHAVRGHARALLPDKPPL